ncbi:MAG TPA: hypothetical protein ENJ19_04865 [Gammaproteobacteria bacterium]|nr:hypothetical protein [Gammaproteobacteria bacterium]
MSSNRTTGLPNLEDAPSKTSTATGKTGNSTMTKLAVVIFSLVILVGAGVAMKTLLFTPKAAAVATSSEVAGASPDSGATGSTPAAGPTTQQPPQTVSDPLDNPPDDGRALDARLVRVEDSLDTLAANQSSLRHDMAASSDAVNARLTGIESTIATLASRIDALQQTRDSDALAQFTAELQQFDQRLIHVEQRAGDNWKQLHGKAGARRRGASLPFRITAVDWWDGKPSVVIRSAKGEQFLSVGDALSGWRLLSADPATGRAHFSRNGLDATLEVAP